jgi:hypothetical protein
MLDDNTVIGVREHMSTNTASGLNTRIHRDNSMDTLYFVARREMYVSSAHWNAGL